MAYEPHAPGQRRYELLVDAARHVDARKGAVDGHDAVEPAAPALGEELGAVLRRRRHQVGAGFESVPVGAGRGTGTGDGAVSSAVRQRSCTGGKKRTGLFRRAGGPLAWPLRGRAGRGPVAGRRGSEGSEPVAIGGSTVLANLRSNGGEMERRAAGRRVGDDERGGGALRCGSWSCSRPRILYFLGSDAA